VVISPCSVEHYELKERYALQDGNFFGLNQSEASTRTYGFICNKVFMCVEPHP
jgi:hypothetical protein